MKFGLAAAVMIAAMGTVAAAQDTASAPAAPAEQASAATTNGDAEPPEEKKICRTERATGSLTRRTRLCLTAAQWREVNTRTYKGVTEMQGSASGSQAIANNPGPGG